MEVEQPQGVATRWFLGRTKATQEANIAFEVAGRLIEQPAEVGDQVKTGQLLRVDRRPLR